MKRSGAPTLCRERLWAAPSLPGLRRRAAARRAHWSGRRRRVDRAAPPSPPTRLRPATTGALPGTAVGHWYRSRGAATTSRSADRIGHHWRLGGKHAPPDVRIATRKAAKKFAAHSAEWAHDGRSGQQRPGPKPTHLGTLLMREFLRGGSHMCQTPHEDKSTALSTSSRSRAEPCRYKEVACPGTRVTAA